MFIFSIGIPSKLCKISFYDYEIVIYYKVSALKNYNDINLREGNI